MKMKRQTKRKIIALSKEIKKKKMSKDGIPQSNQDLHEGPLRYAR